MSSVIMDRTGLKVQYVTFREIQEDLLTAAEYSIHFQNHLILEGVMGGWSLSQIPTGEGGVQPGNVASLLRG